MISDKQYLNEIYQKYKEQKTSKSKEEFYNIKFKNTTQNILKLVATFIITIGISAGLVYATTQGYKAIWKEPQKYTFNMEITEEVPVQQDKLTIAIPKESLTDTALENLQKIIANKQMLFQRAFQTDSTEVEITEEKINFTWFPYTTDSDEIAAYTQFISRLCDTARDAKRVPSKPTETDNDKYAFRCFLLRLGFIGKEYKTARKILLRNLTGNSAFRSVK